MEVQPPRTTALVRLDAVFGKSLMNMNVEFISFADHMHTIQPVPRRFGRDVGRSISILLPIVAAALLCSSHHDVPRGYSKPFHP